MADDECVALLQWALPRLGLRWSGFRKVRRQVCRRVTRRLRELGLADADAYRRHLAAHPDEWAALDALCRVTISRFWLDRRVFETLRDEVLHHDVRDAPPDGPFDLVLCRNLAFTYFADELQRATARRLVSVLRPGGLLVVGAHETPPSDALEPLPGARGLWRRAPEGRRRAASPHAEPRGG